VYKNIDEGTGSNLTSNFQNLSEKQNKDLKKTGIFTQNRFFKKSTLVFGVTIKQMTVGT